MFSSLVVRHPKSADFAASAAGIYLKFTPSIFIDYQQRFRGKLTLKMDVEHSSEIPKSVSKPTWARSVRFLNVDHNHNKITCRILFADFCLLPCDTV
jgi:hypothetical protein